MANNLIPAVEKALQLLEMLGQADRALHKQEMESALAIAPSTCYRILQTLQKEGWARKTGTNTWTAGNSLLNAARNMLDREARFTHLQPELDLLSKQTGLSCKLSLRRGDQQYTLLRGESGKRVQVSSKTGIAFPLIEGSVGAVLLSGDTEESIRKLASKCEEDLPEKTNPEQILDRIGEVRKKGWCLNTHSRWNICALSVPVRDRDGNVAAALTLLGWEEDFSGNKRIGLVRTLERMAAAFSEKLES